MKGELIAGRRIPVVSKRSLKQRVSALNTGFTLIYERNMVMAPEVLNPPIGSWQYIAGDHQGGTNNWPAYRGSLRTVAA